MTNMGVETDDQGLLRECPVIVRWESTPTDRHPLALGSDEHDDHN